VALPCGFFKVPKEETKTLDELVSEGLGRPGWSRIRLPVLPMNREVTGSVMRRCPISNPVPLARWLRTDGAAAGCLRPSSPPDERSRLALPRPFPPCAKPQTNLFGLSHEIRPLSLLENNASWQKPAGFLPDQPVGSQNRSYDRRTCMCFGH